jgi:BirA family transcriptional regulator, biotin operon repressor / biotin---[acetyl-CoA-carboxylase] ligase
MHLMLTFQIQRFDSLPSTNLEAARLAAEGAAEGVCVVTREQTAGRGRLQRAWQSPKDAGLYFSMVLRPTLPQQAWPILTLMAAVAVHQALRDAFEIDADIKWPNDLLVNDKKICGILAETVETKLGRAVVLGIGVNLTKNAFPEVLKREATAVEVATGHRAEPETLLGPLTKALGKYYELLGSAEGAQSMLDEWTSRSSYALGKFVRVVEGDKSFLGTTRGLERDGALRVETDSGEIRVVRAGDVQTVRAA